MKYETIIGLEIHCQLLCESKMFCSCSTKFGAAPNTNICPVCTGQPGVLPKINKKAIELAIKTALALNCKIEPGSIFARKNYFYPDLPKNYQISQYELPLATNGYLEIEVEGQKKKIGVTRVHLEEDAGKLVHKGAERIMGSAESLVDYNRGGTPLMEIVSEPDIRSPFEAKVYMETLARLLRYIQVSDAKMEEGSLRCDANISIRPAGETKLGIKTELKNVNSFRFVQKGLEAEEKRHREMMESGEKIVQETRYFDTNTEDTKSMRSKEFAHDYRYFPEPDLVEIEPEAKWIEEITASIGELPEGRKERYIKEYELTEQDANNLINDDKSIPDYFEDCINLIENTSIKDYAKEIARSWINGEMRAIHNAFLDDNTKLNDRYLAGFFRNRNFTPNKLIDIIKLIRSGTINYNQGKLLINEAIKPENKDKQLNNLASELNLIQISNEEELIKIAREVINGNSKQVDQFKAGKDTVIMFLVGQVMKLSKGRANPDLAQKLLRKIISESPS